MNLTEDMEARIVATDVLIRAFHVRNIAAEKAKWANANLQAAEDDLEKADRALAVINEKFKENA
jgi:hypothetical protein